MIFVLPCTDWRIMKSWRPRSTSKMEEIFRNDGQFVFDTSVVYL